MFDWRADAADPEKGYIIDHGYQACPLLVTRLPHMGEPEIWGPNMDPDIL